MPRKPKKINICEELEISIEGTIESAISELQDYLKEGYTGIEISTEQLPYDSNYYPCVYLSRIRPETDKEYEKRIALEESRKKSKKEQERKEYERLNKLYGQKSS